MKVRRCSRFQKKKMMFKKENRQAKLAVETKLRDTRLKEMEEKLSRINEMDQKVRPTRNHRSKMKMLKKEKKNLEMLKPQCRIIIHSTPVQMKMLKIHLIRRRALIHLPKKINRKIPKWQKMPQKIQSKVRQQKLRCSNLRLERLYQLRWILFHMW